MENIKNINEASTLSSFDKMKAFDSNNTATQNNASSNEKDKLLQQGLLDYAGGITIEDLDLAEIKKVKEDYDNGIVFKEDLIKMFAKISQTTIKNLIFNLLISIVFKLKENIEAIKEYFNSIGITNEQIKELVESILADKVLLAKLNEILGQINNQAKQVSQSVQQPKQPDISLKTICDKIDVAAPLYRGANYPPFDEFKVNESKIPDGMRSKFSEFLAIDTAVEHSIKVIWVTQENFDNFDAQLAMNEIVRAVSKNLKKFGYSKDVSLEVEFECRNGQEYGHEIFTKVITANDIASLLENYIAEEIKPTTPYMLRNDGKLLTCGDAHPYIKIWKTASFEDNYKNLILRVSDIDWFIQNTLLDEAKAAYIQLKENVENNIIDEAAFERANDFSDQEFCRVRTSNFKYNYGGDNGEIYFRISSDGFNWFNLIWDVVNHFKNQIKFVTIMKDKIIRGQKLEYISDGKNIFNKMPVDEFLTLSGNPVVEDLKINEDIEKHDTLNPKLWNSDNTLKTEVEDKINQIINEFILELHEDDIDIKIDDVILIGSNCSYNYTKDSDLDIHIIANRAKSKYSADVTNKLYSAYRTIFNKNFDIDFYGIPVEIYVEDENSARVSNGIYSVMNKAWIKEPVVENIPEIDMEAINNEFKVWEDRYNEILSSCSTLEEAVDIGSWIPPMAGGAALGNAIISPLLRSQTLLILGKAFPTGTLIGIGAGILIKAVSELIRLISEKREKNKNIDLTTDKDIINNITNINIISDAKTAKKIVNAAEQELNVILPYPFIYNTVALPELKTNSKIVDEVK